VRRAFSETSALSLVIAIIASTAFDARADPSATGKGLFEWCTSKPYSPEDAACSMYIAGFVHGFMVASAKDKTNILCLPAGFTPDEARAIFLRIMRSLDEQGPNFLTDERVDLALAATLGINFHCGTDQQRQRK
jgi:hypothetical protein